MLGHQRSTSAAALHSSTPSCEQIEDQMASTLVAMASNLRAFLLLVAMPLVTSSFLLLVVRPGAPSSVLAPSSDGLQPMFLDSS